MDIRDAIRSAAAHRDIPTARMEEIMDGLFRGDIPPVAVAGLLVALSMKGESAGELAAAVRSMRAHARFVPCPDPKAIDIVGTGGDGAATLNISTAAALVAAAAGATVAKHGNRAFSSRSGSADVLSCLGVKADTSPERMEICLKDAGIAFLFAPALHPAARHTVEARRAIGIRTLFNLCGPLCNPAGVRRGLFGAYSERAVRIMASAAAETGLADHMLFVHGRDGLDEITLCDKTLVLEVRGAQITEWELDPRDYGLQFVAASALTGGEPEDNALAIRRLLSGEKSAFRDAVLLSAAAGLYTAGKAPDIAAALPLARAALDSGAAATTLEKLARLSQE